MDFPEVAEGCDRPYRGLLPHTAYATGLTLPAPQISNWKQTEPAWCHTITPREKHTGPLMFINLFILICLQFLFSYFYV